MAIWSLMFVIGSLGWVGLLLGIMLGRPWLVYSLETTSVQVVPLVALPYFLVCYLASFELCGGGAYIDGAAFRAVPADPDAASSTPAVLFAALFTQGLMQVVSSISERTLLVTPALVVHVLTFLYYLAVHLTPGCGCTLASRYPHARLGVLPLHYALWAASISIQVLSLYGLRSALETVGRAQGGRAQAGVQGGGGGAQGNGPRQAGAAAGGEQRRVCVALLSIQGMLWSGALGEVYLPSSAHPICLLLIGLSFACFYTLIYNGVYLPLADCRARALAIDDPQHKQRAWRYSAISAYLIVAWHGFPLLWLANQMGLGTGAQLTTGYVGTDVLAKFLPPSLYISVATAP